MLHVRATSRTCARFHVARCQDKYVVGAVSGGVDSSVAAVRNAQEGWWIEPVGGRLRVVKKGVVVCGSMDSNTPDFRTSWTWKPVPDLAFELGVFGARTWLDPILMLVFRAGLWVSMAQVF